MRVTLQFGPWSPDLANTPLQYNDQPGPIQVPAADCLNVYYANGTYKSIASPQTATIDGNAVAVLSNQILGAFSFFDNVQQQKSLMAGSASGVSQLNANGTWTAVPFYIQSVLQNINSVSFWSFAAMGPYIVGVPYTPNSTMTGPYLWSDQGLSGNGNTFTQPPTTANVTQVPGGRVGSVVAQFLMVGDVLDAQTQLIGTGNGSTVNFSALLSNTPMLAAGSVYDSDGQISGTFGDGLITGTGLALPPALPGTSSTLNSLGDVYSFPARSYVNSVFSVTAATDPTTSAFTSITVNGVTRTSSSATYSYAAGIATWTWTAGAFGLVSGTLYAVTFTGGSFSTAIVAGTASAIPTNGYSPYQHQALYDNFPSGIYSNSLFQLQSSTNPGSSAFTSITANGVTQTSSSATYTYASGIATWTWTSGAFGFSNGSTYPVTFTGANFFSTMTAGQTTIGGLHPTTLKGFQVSTVGSDTSQSIFTGFQLSSSTGSQTAGQNTINYTTGALNLSLSAAPAGAGTITGVTITGTAGQFSGSPSVPMVVGQTVTISGTFGGTGSISGYVNPTSYLISVTNGTSTFTLTTLTGGALVTTAGTPTGLTYTSVADLIYASYTQVAPFRVWWSAIGDPTNWPIPLTANAIAFQSGYQDLNPAQGPVMFIAGYPLYGLIFQLTGITRANYVGGNVVFSFGLYSQNRGLICHGGAIQVGTLVYFLSQDGFFVTDGNSISPIGTDQDNRSGIDNWFWANVNQAALSAIYCAYDDTTRCVYFAIATGANTLPDTLLTYNPIANYWTRAQIATEMIFTDDNGSSVPATEIRLGLFNQSHQYSSLLGATLSGYIESCDLMPTDMAYRLTTGIRPNIACTDTPQALAGSRNSMQSAVTYTTSAAPDSFSHLVPVLQNALYTRARVSSGAASALNGATLEQQNGGFV